jgi:hypothetical protein
VVYKKKQKSILGKKLEIDFEQLLKERKPQGVNTSFKSSEEEVKPEEDISII